MVQLEFLVPRGLKEIKVIVGTLDLQEGQCTYAGGGPLVPLTRELI